MTAGTYRDYCPRCNTRQPHRKGRFGPECVACLDADDPLPPPPPICAETLEMFPSTEEAA